MYDLYVNMIPVLAFIYGVTKFDLSYLQTQFYMLSRLLHDYYEPVYEFLLEYDITPTLYAAPWFLTLFASHFPIGFVVRVLG